MAKKRRRGISCGTLFMVLVTALAVGLCALILPRFLGDMMDTRLDTQRLLGALSQNVEVETQPSPARGQVTQGPGTIEEAPAPTDAPTPEPKVAKLTICAVGSLYATKNIRQAAYDQQSETYAFNSMFEDIRPILSAADLTLGTLETTTAGKEAGYGEYNTPVQYLDALKYAGFDLLSLGTERALEHGLPGLVETLNQVQSKGLLAVGAYATEDEVGQAQLFQINGIQVAVLGYTYDLSTEAAKKTPKGDRFATPLAQIGTMRTDIAAARRAGADLVIVMAHWGKRDSLKPSDNQKTLARQLADAGADIVLGTHTDVVQGLEEGPLVAYSLGSLLSDESKLANATGVILQLEVEMDPATRQITLSQIAYTPTWVYRGAKVDGKYSFQVLRAGNEDAGTALDAGSRRAKASALEQVQKTMGDKAILVP